MLTLGGAVADFALAAYAQSVFKCVMRFAFVEPDLGTALHVDVEQPFDDEQRSFNPVARQSKCTITPIKCAIDVIFPGISLLIFLAPFFSIAHLIGALHMLIRLNASLGLDCRDAGQAPAVGSPPPR